MSRVRRFALPLLLLLGSAVHAAPPDWVTALAERGSAGVREHKHRILLDYTRCELNPAQKSTRMQCRVAVRIGGPNGYADFSYPIHHTASDEFNSLGAWQIAPAGKITPLARKLLTKNQAFPQHILYADDIIRLWGCNNLEVGSVVALEYEIVTPFLLECGNLYLQDNEADVDSAVVEFSVPPESHLRLTPHGLYSNTVMIGERRVAAGGLKAWEEAPLRGDFAVSATRIAYALYPDRTATPPVTWPDISTRIAAEWAGIPLRLERDNYLAAPPADRLALARFIDRFEQDFRYVAVEIGVGRFVPHEPRHVLSMRYGDCKDLSFFLTTLLAGSGVSVVPVLVRVPAYQPFQPDFPYEYQFNHCIVAIVTASDTLYYDPTARGYALGVLPWADQGAYALWVQPGADLRQLPRDEEPWSRRRQLRGTLDSRGRLTGTVTAEYDARFSRRDWQDVAAEAGRRWVRTLLREDLTVDVAALRLDPDTRTLEAEVSISNYARSAGDLLYWKPCPFRLAVPDSICQDSPQGFYAGCPSREEDRIEITLPADRRPPEPLDLETATTAGTVELALSADSTLVRGHWQRMDQGWYYPPAAAAALDSFHTACRNTHGLYLKIPRRPSP